VNFDILNTTVEIVGIVGHVKQWGLDESGASPVQAQCYLPITQIPDKFMPLLAANLGVMVRTSGSPLAQVGSIRHAMDEINSKQVMYGTETMDRIVSDSLSAQRFSMILMGIFAALALVMASVGVYGVVSYFTSQRTHEIGIRMALGARRADVLKLMIGQGFKMTSLGVGIGVLGALALTRFLSSLLFGVKPRDPLTFFVVCLILTCVAMLACYIPARRATKADPMAALRYE
jgi:ABC-type antimicrobial peptide transport system permease subunit